MPEKNLVKVVYPPLKEEKTQIFVHFHTSVSFSSRTLLNFRNHPRPCEACFIKWTISGEPHVGSKSQQTSKWGHSFAVLLVTYWLPPCTYQVSYISTLHKDLAPAPRLTDVSAPSWWRARGWVCSVQCPSPDIIFTPDSILPVLGQSTAVHWQACLWLVKNGSRGKQFHDKCHEEIFETKETRTQDYIKTVFQSLMASPWLPGAYNWSHRVVCQAHKSHTEYLGWPLEWLTQTSLSGV